MRVNIPTSFGAGMGPLGLQQRPLPNAVPLTPGVPQSWSPDPAQQLGQVGGFFEYWSALGIVGDLLRL